MINQVNWQTKLPTTSCLGLFISVRWLGAGGSISKEHLFLVYFMFAVADSEM
jgi:hypothetical protein